MCVRHGDRRREIEKETGSTDLLSFGWWWCVVVCVVCVMGGGWSVERVSDGGKGALDFDGLES